MFRSVFSTKPEHPWALVGQQDRVEEGAGSGVNTGVQILVRDSNMTLDMLLERFVPPCYQLKLRRKNTFLL